MPWYTSSSLIHFVFTQSLDGINFGLYLILCYFINLVQPKHTVFIKSTMFQCTVFYAFTFTSHSLADSHRAIYTPESFVHGKCSIQVYHFFIFYTIFLPYFPMFIYVQTHTYHCVTVVYSISNILYRFVAQKQQIIPYSVLCSKAIPSRFVQGQSTMFAR